MHQKTREDLLEIKSFIEEETGDIELAKKTVFGYSDYE